MSKKKEAKILGQIINELQDEHVSLQTQFGIYRFRKRIAQQTEESYERYFIKTIINNQTIHILTNKDSILLIRVKNLDNEIILSDSIWKIIYNSKGLIIDLSNNGGGNERYAREFSEKFANDTLKFKSYRFNTSKGRNDFTEWKYGYLYPKSKSLFSGHIVCIINSSCYSSCEAFALMLKSLPNCSLIGLKTGGSSGYPKKFILDNGWTYTISTWQEADIQKKLIEGNGIFPNITIEMDKKYLVALKIISSEIK